MPLYLASTPKELAASALPPSAFVQVGSLLPFQKDISYLFALFTPKMGSNYFSVKQKINAFLGVALDAAYIFPYAGYFPVPVNPFKGLRSIPSTFLTEGIAEIFKKHKSLSSADVDKGLFVQVVACQTPDSWHVKKELNLICRNKEGWGRFYAISPSEFDLAYWEKEPDPFSLLTNPTDGGAPGGSYSLLSLQETLKQNAKDGYWDNVYYNMLLHFARLFRPKATDVPLSRKEEEEVPSLPKFVRFCSVCFAEYPSGFGGIIIKKCLC